MLLARCSAHHPMTQPCVCVCVCQYEIREIRYETWDMRYEIWDMRHETWDMRYEIYYLHAVLGIIQCGGLKSILRSTLNTHEHVHCHHTYIRDMTHVYLHIESDMRYEIWGKTHVEAYLHIDKHRHIDIDT